MEVEFPLGFGLSNDVIQEYEDFILSQAMSWGKYKRTAISHFEKVLPSLMVDGHLVYDSTLLLTNTNDYESDNSLFLKEVVGFDNIGLDKITESWGIDGIDKLYFNFKVQHNANLSSTDENGFQLILNNFSDLTDSIHMVEIYQNISYSCLKSNPDYSSSNCLTCNECEGEDCEDCTKYCAGYIDNLPEDRIAIDLRLYELSEFKDVPVYSRPFDLNYNGLQLTRTDLLSTNSYAQMILPKNIKCYDVNGTEITILPGLSITEWQLIKRIYTILYQNNSMFDFISKEKLNEYEYAVTDPYGDYSRFECFQKTTISGKLKTNAVDNRANLFYPTVVDVDGNTIYMSKYKDWMNGEQLVNWHVYSFWHWAETFLVNDNIDSLSNDMLLYSNGKIYLKVDALKNATAKDWIKYVTPFYNIKVTYDDPEFLGIGGTLGAFLSGLFRMVGLLMNYVTNGLSKLFYELGELLQFNAMLRELGVSENTINRTIHIISKIIVTVVIAWFTGGFGAGAALTTTEVIMLAINIGVTGYMAGESFDESEDIKTSNKKREQLTLAQEELAKEMEDSEHEDFEINSMSDKKELIKALNYDPFLRMDIAEQMKYDSLNRFDNMDNYEHIMT